MFQSGSEGRAAQQCAVLTRLLSPLLANIALSALDDHFDRQRREQMGTDQQRAKRKRNGLGNWKIVRYADDCAPRTLTGVAM
jgi:retron-type reverse transcriptase